jgi:hypothetical protein
MSRKFDVERPPPAEFLYQVDGDPKVYEGRWLATSTTRRFVKLDLTGTWRDVTRLWVLEELDSPVPQPQKSKRLH